MSTHSRIGIMNDDGTITSIYVHFDGYTSHNGKILVEHYRDEAKTRELMALGDLSCLGPEIGVEHLFTSTYNLNSEEYAQHRSMCLAYGRDRGETGVEAQTSVDAKAFEMLMEEYNYMYVMGRWMVRGWTTDDKWLLVEDQLAREAAEQDG